MAPPTLGFAQASITRFSALAHVRDTLTEQSAQALWEAEVALDAEKRRLADDNAHNAAEPNWLAALRNEMRQGFHEVRQEVRQGLHNNTVAINALRERVDHVEVRVGRVETRLVSIEEKVGMVLQESQIMFNQLNRAKATAEFPWKKVLFDDGTDPVDDRGLPYLSTPAIISDLSLNNVISYEDGYHIDRGARSLPERRAQLARFIGGCL
ncbi:hypothetical protein D9611_012236 [Ephemerocybe angulata]|uniref:Mug135-like C-terminal domain-containing protein n=1 Tax=Ephemerocybe angulata TaxID=980116 RepID=A0A8H5FGG2_9AGAR|nr:hypothetical protein D9611_012236 [Tulosesus angulatus]